MTVLPSLIDSFFISQGPACRQLQVDDERRVYLILVSRTGACAVTGFCDGIVNNCLSLLTLIPHLIRHYRIFSTQSGSLSKPHPNLLRNCAGGATKPMRSISICHLCRHLHVCVTDPLFAKPLTPTNVLRQNNRNIISIGIGIAYNQPPAPHPPHLTLQDLPHQMLLHS